VKGFYSGALAHTASVSERAAAPVAAPVHRVRNASAVSREPEVIAGRPCSGRIAVYDGAGAAPRVEDVTSPDVSDFIEDFAVRIYSLAREAGGAIPYTVIREVAENLVHADFREPVASILDGGRTVRFSDQGPGISDKERALLPGFTTASGSAKQYIRGVGSGLPIVQDYVRFSGGSLLIEDNLGSGAVVTVRSGVAPKTAASLRAATVANDLSASVTASAMPASNEALWQPEFVRENGPSIARSSAPTLTRRQKQVLAFVAETGGAGPSVVAKELVIGVSTAYRDLASLEDRGLLVSDDSGRRTVTDEGLRTLETFMAG
jgi:Histidine kinase-, DNA gyrase B-, and HSP90-like ATPase